MGYAAANAIGRVYVLEEVVVTAEGAGLTLGGLTLGEAAAALGVAALEVLSGPVGWGLLAVGVIAIGYGIYQSTKSEDDSESKPKSGNDDGVQVKDEPAEDVEQQKGQDEEPEDKGNPQDKRLTKGEIKKLQDKGVDPHDLKPNSKFDLFKDRDGNISVKPKNGTGPGDPTGFNINDF